MLFIPLSTYYTIDKRTHIFIYLTNDTDYDCVFNLRLYLVEKNLIEKNDNILVYIYNIITKNVFCIDQTGMKYNTNTLTKMLHSISNIDKSYSISYDNQYVISYNPVEFYLDLTKLNVNGSVLL